MKEEQKQEADGCQRLVAWSGTCVAAALALCARWSGHVGGCGRVGALRGSGSLVSKPRLLALAADASFAQPETSVALRQLLALPEPERVRWAYATCTDPRASSTDGCLTALDGSFQTELAEEGLPLQLEAADAYEHTQLGVMFVACPGEVERGETGFVPVVCRDASGLLRASVTVCAPAPQPTSHTELPSSNAVSA